MAFYAKTFVFDGKPSELFNLYISSDSVETSSGGSADVKLYTEEIYRNPIPHLYGVQQTPPLQFDVYFTSPTPIPAPMAEAIQSWLFGQMGYKHLQIVQDDMHDIFYNCFLVKPSIVRVANQIIGFRCSVLCDAPWAWASRKIVSNDFPDDIYSGTFTIYNQTDNNAYTYPTMSILISAVGGDISIINDSDNHREFLMTDLNGIETVTIDNQLQIIQSSTGLKRLSHFNLKWFRLVKGKNIIRVDGNVNNITVNYPLARKIGG